MKLLHWPRLMPGRIMSDNDFADNGYGDGHGTCYGYGDGFGGGYGCGYGFGEGNGYGYGNTKGTRYD